MQLTASFCNWSERTPTIFFAHAETEHSIPGERKNVCSILRTLGRIIVHQLLEHLLPAGELYIYKSVCVVQITAVHAEKALDALIKMRFVVM